MSEQEVSDPEARQTILEQFYHHYRKGGLHIIVDAHQVARDLGLKNDQARRCLDYLEAKGLIRPMTRGGGYSPTVDLVDEVELVREADNG